MKRMKIGYLVSLLLLSAAASCGAAGGSAGSAGGAAASSTTASTLPTGVAARVNGVDITQEQLNAEVKKLSPVVLGQVTPEFIDAIKTQLIANELIRQAAQQQKLENDPAVQEAVRYAQSAAMVQAYVRKNVKPEPVTDADVRKKYDELLAQLGTVEYKARTIETDNTLTASVVEGELAKGKDFAEMAKRYSSAKNKKEGGEMPWVSFKNPPQKGKTQGLSLLVANTLLTLAPGGQTAKPLLDDNKYIFIKLDAVRPTQVPAYDEAKGPIKQALESQAQQQASVRLMSELMSKATIEQ